MNKKTLTPVSSKIFVDVFSRRYDPLSQTTKYDIYEVYKEKCKCCESVVDKQVIAGYIVYDGEVV